jgi:hypothetical protein
VVVLALAAALILPWTALIFYAGQNAPADRARARAANVADVPAVAPLALAPKVDVPSVLPAPGPTTDVSRTPARDNGAARAKSVQPQKRDEGTVKPIPPVPSVAVEGASSGAAPVLEQPRGVRSEAVQPSESGAERLARLQQQCDGRMGLGRALCREAARWKHCHPDKWYKAPECMVHEFDTGDSTS